MMNRNNSNRFRHFYKLYFDKVANYGNKIIIQTCAITFFVLMLVVVVITSDPLVGTSMKLNENDTGKTVEMLVGDELEVILPGNPATGYAWELISLDSNVIRPDKAEYFAINKAVGTGGVEVVKFRAIAAGKSDVKLIFHRSFEVNVPPLKTFEVTINIKKSFADLFKSK
jgi:inhibitor of cysteine peptidase